MSSIEGQTPQSEHSLTPEAATPTSKRLIRAACAVAGLALLSGTTTAAEATEQAPASLVYLQYAEAGPLATMAGPQTQAELPPAEATGNKPNIIFFLADDLESSQLKYMPNTRKYIFERGATFTNYFTGVGLCCSARASIFTGKYAMNTGILGNEYPDGFAGFHKADENRDTYAISLKAAGYVTSLLGKYLNEYPSVESSPSHAVRRTYVPRGWSDWMVPVGGQYYAGNNYVLNHNGKLEHHSRPHDYLGDYTARHMLSLIRTNKDHKGLAVEFSSYAPHVPEPTSPIEKRNKKLQRRISRIHYPRTPDFNEADVSDKPRAIQRLPRMGRRQIRNIDATYRRQILADKSIDRYVGATYRMLKRTHQLDNTYMVFTSDNGYHMGNHRMHIGKNAPYDTDIKLPFAIAGPSITPGTQVSELATNIDIAPTFTDIAGLPPASSYDGGSLLPLAQGKSDPDWRKYFLVQRGYVTAYGAKSSSEEPGAPGESQHELAMSRYFGVVTRDWRYIDNLKGRDELYNVKNDPYETHNLLAATLSPEANAWLTKLRLAETALRGCRGVVDCTVQ